jgi:hypothetical protein
MLEDILKNGSFVVKILKIEHNGTGEVAHENAKTPDNFLCRR